MVDYTPSTVPDGLPAEAALIYRKERILRGEVAAWAAVRAAGFERGDGATWVKRHMASLYVARPLRNGAALREWAQKNTSIPNLVDADRMHVTIAFSPDPVDWDVIEESWMGDSDEELVAEGGPRFLTRLGKTHEVAVLRFSSRLLRWRHEDLKEQGAVWRWPDYQPHVTLSYDVPQDVDISATPAFDGPLRFGPEKVEEVNPDYA